MASADCRTSPADPNRTSTGYAADGASPAAGVRLYEALRYEITRYLAPPNATKLPVLAMHGPLTPVTRDTVWLGEPS